MAVDATEHVGLNEALGIEYLGGSAVTNVGFTGQTYTVDTIPPAVTSFVPTGPTDTNAAAVGYTITFREPVVGLSVGNFTLTTDPTVSGAQITGLTPVSASTYTLTVGTGTGDGNLWSISVDIDHGQHPGWLRLCDCDRDNQTLLLIWIAGKPEPDLTRGREIVQRARCRRADESPQSWPDRRRDAKIP